MPPTKQEEGKTTSLVAEKLLAVGKNLQDAFTRYDYDSNEKISSSDEAKQLTLNIVFALGLPANVADAAHIDTLVQTRDWTAEPLDVDGYAAWFDDHFLRADNAPSMVTSMMGGTMSMGASLRDSMGDATSSLQDSMGDALSTVVDPALLEPVVPVIGMAKMSVLQLRALHLKDLFLRKTTFAFGGFGKDNIDFELPSSPFSSGLDTTGITMSMDAPGQATEAEEPAAEEDAPDSQLSRVNVRSKLNHVKGFKINRVKNVYIGDRMQGAYKMVGSILSCCKKTSDYVPWEAVPQTKPVPMLISTVENLIVAVDATAGTLIKMSCYSCDVACGHGCAVLQDGMYPPKTFLIESNDPTQNFQLLAVDKQTWFDRVVGPICPSNGWTDRPGSYMLLAGNEKLFETEMHYECEDAGMCGGCFSCTQTWCAQTAVCTGADACCAPSTYHQTYDWNGQELLKRPIVDVTTQSCSDCMYGCVMCPCLTASAPFHPVMYSCSADPNSSDIVPTLLIENDKWQHVVDEAAHSRRTQPHLLEMEQSVKIFRPACCCGQSYISQEGDPGLPCGGYLMEHLCFAKAPAHVTYQPRMDVLTGELMANSFTKFAPDANKETLGEMKKQLAAMCGPACEDCLGAADEAIAGVDELQNVMAAASEAIDKGKELADSAQEAADAGQELTDEAKAAADQVVVSCFDPEVKRCKERLSIQFCETTSPEQKLAALTYMMEKIISDRD
jgi:hypothetical protein